MCHRSDPWPPSQPVSPVALPQFSCQGTFLGRDSQRPGSYTSPSLDTPSSQAILPQMVCICYPTPPTAFSTRSLCLTYYAEASLAEQCILFSGDRLGLSLSPSSAHPSSRVQTWMCLPDSSRPH